MCIRDSSDVVIDKSENIKIQHIYAAFYFDDIFFSHFVAAGVFDDGNTAVQFVKFQIMINCHGFAGFDVIQNKSLFDTSYI